MKLCNTCNEEKPKARFEKNRCICMDCRAKQVAEKRAADRMAGKLPEPRTRRRKTKPGNPWLDLRYPVKVEERKGWDQRS